MSGSTGRSLLVQNHPSTCQPSVVLDVLDRFDQPPGALKFFRCAQGGIAEREALDADANEVLQDLGGLLRSGRVGHDTPLGGDPFHYRLWLSLGLPPDA